IQVLTVQPSIVGQTIHGAASQTADLLQFYDSSSNLLSGFNATGNLFISTTSAPNKVNINTATTPDAAAQVLISTGGTSNTGLAIQGVPGQSATLFEVQSSTGAQYFFVNSVGDTRITGTNSY